MMTLALKEKFAELAHTDHLHRVRAVLSELDAGYGFSEQPEFEQVLARHVLQLKELGLCSAYQQACVLFCILSGSVEIEALPKTESSAGLHKHCVQQALSNGVAAGLFEHIHRMFAGIGSINEVWLDPKGESDLLEFVSLSRQFLQTVLVACNQHGPFLNDTELIAGTSNYSNTKPITESISGLLPLSEVNFFRCDSGFQHKLTDKFTPLEMLKQVCGFAIPQDKAVVSLHPIVSRCDLGKLVHNHFERMQQIEVMDARQFIFNLTQHELVLSEHEIHQLQTNWQSPRFLQETQIQVQRPIINCDLQLQAGWVKESKEFNFKIRGHACVEIPSAAFHWYATLVHEDLLVHLSLQPLQNFRMEWDLTQAWKEGGLPVDQPLLLREHKLPIAVSCLSAAGVGQAVLSAPHSLAGHLLLTMLVSLDAKTRRLEFELILSHSVLTCDWQFACPLRGGSKGSWNLLPQAPIARWKLPHG